MSEARAPYDTATAGADDERAVTAANGSGPVPSKRRRSPIPHRNPTVRRRVREMVDVLGYEATTGDVYALTRWAHLYEKWRSIGERLDRDGDLKKDGDPKKLLGEWRALSDTLSRLEAALGITAAARASLGVDVGRMRKLAGDGASPADEAAVNEMEARVLERLGSPSEEDVRDAARDVRERA